MTDRSLPPIGDRLVLASSNPGKLAELDQLVRRYGIAGEPIARWTSEALPESGATFEQNAIAKARAAAVATGLPALADDSGLEVDSLGGAPGVQSARWTGPERDFTVGIRRVYERMRAADGMRERGARYVCALCLCWPSGSFVTSIGVLRGEIVHPPCGEDRTSYDTIFRPSGASETLALSSLEILPHRADAFARLMRDLPRGVQG